MTFYSKCDRDSHEPSLLWSAMVVISLLLASCGGGSSSSTTGPSIRGTAAIGLAVAGATVEAKCNGGTGAGITAADGTYSLSLSSGSLPCVLKVATPSGDLYSVATGTGTTVTANITPFTQLVVANLTGKDPAAYFTGFAASDIATLTPSVVSAAQTAVKAVLASSGIDTSALPADLVTGNLVAATGSTSGNSYDMALDALKATLTNAGNTLAGLTNSVVVRASCPALRSGVYRMIVPQVGALGTHGNSSTQKLTFDMAVPSITDASGTVLTLTPTTGSQCRFGTSGGGDLVVAQSGAFAMYTSKGLFGVGFPEQEIALADLAGDWNFLLFDRATAADPLGPVSFNGPISSAGVFTPAATCADAKTCVTTVLPPIPMTVNAAGGYDFHFSNTGYSRFFAFRTDVGDLMLAGTSEDGTFGFGTIRRTNALPSAGKINAFWNVDTINLATGAGSATTYGPKGVAIADAGNTITSIDLTGDFFTRNQITNFSTVPVTTRPETIYANAVAGTSRQGYRWRKPETVTNSAGMAVNVPETIQLPLRGTGLTISALPNANVAFSRFSVSVDKP